MSSKMNYIPHISSYEDIRAEMSNDLQYRLASRTAKTSLGRPLYYRINVLSLTIPRHRSVRSTAPSAWNDRTLCRETMISMHKSRR